MTRFSPQANHAITQVYDDPGQQQLADRIEELLDLFDKDHFDPRLRRFRMQTPKLWLIRVHGSGRDFILLWDLGPDEQPFIRYAGEAF